MKGQKKYFYVALTGWLMLGALVVGYTVYAWTAPASNPPAGNVSAPLNVSSSSQEKLGALTTGSIVNNGTSLFKGVFTLTPIANSVSSFNITNASGTSIFKIDSSNSRVGINVVTPSSAFDISGGINATGTIAGNALSATAGITGASCTVGTLAGTAGTLSFTGNIQSPTGGNISTSGAGKITAPSFCIDTSCITSWPTGGDPVPSGGSILSTLPALAGYTTIPGNIITSSNMTPYNIFTKP